MPQLKFTLSHSAVNSFKTCPALYKATYISNDVKFESNKYSQLGVAVHKLAEWFVKDFTGQPCYRRGIAQDPFFAANIDAAMKAADAHLVNAEDVFNHWTNLHATLVKLLIALTANGHELSQNTVLCEAPLAMRIDEQTGKLVRADYGAKDSIRRGKVDLVILVKDLAWCIDYKTGATIKDDGQLQQNALLVMANYEQVKTVLCMSLSTQGLQPLRKMVAAGGREHEGVDEVLGGILNDNGNIIQAYAEDNFPPTPNGLCKAFCGHKKCAYNGGKKV